MSRPTYALRRLFHRQRLFVRVRTCVYVYLALNHTIHSWCNRRREGERFSARERNYSMWTLLAYCALRLRLKRFHPSKNINKQKFFEKEKYSSWIYCFWYAVKERNARANHRSLCVLSHCVAFTASTLSHPSLASKQSNLNARWIWTPNVLCSVFTSLSTIIHLNTHIALIRIWYIRRARNMKTFLFRLCCRRRHHRRTNKRMKCVRERDSNSQLSLSAKYCISHNISCTWIKINLLLNYSFGNFHFCIIRRHRCDAVNSSPAIGWERERERRACNEPLTQWMNPHVRSRALIQFCECEHETNIHHVLAVTAMATTTTNKPKWRCSLLPEMKNYKMELITRGWLLNGSNDT